MTKQEIKDDRQVADIITALESKTVWTAKELAEFFKCSIQEINMLGRQGRLPSYPLTSHLRRYCGPTLAEKLAAIEQGSVKKRKKKS